MNAIKNLRLFIIVSIISLLSQQAISLVMPSFTLDSTEQHTKVHENSPAQHTPVEEPAPTCHSSKNTASAPAPAPLPAAAASPLPAPAASTVPAPSIDQTTSHTAGHTADHTDNHESCDSGCGNCCVLTTGLVSIDTSQPLIQAHPNLNSQPTTNYVSFLSLLPYKPPILS